MGYVAVHSGAFFNMACAARDRAAAAVKANPEDLPQDTLVAIVMSAVAVEGFINELAELIAAHALNREVGIVKLSDSMIAFASAMGEIERARGSLHLKYLIASQILSGSMFDKGSNPFQDFATLVTVRNDIMHLKPQDKTVFVEGGLPRVEPPKYVKVLQQYGLAKQFQDEVIASWLTLLQTAEMAAWACDTARNMVHAVLDFFPDTEPMHEDPAWMLKIAFGKRRSEEFR